MQIDEPSRFSTSARFNASHESQENAEYMGNFDIVDMEMMSPIFYTVYIILMVPKSWQRLIYLNICA